MQNSSLNTRHARSSRAATWPGHLEITSRSLLSILVRSTTDADPSRISIAERSLFMACEFWAATKGRTLVAHLGTNASEPLRIMGTIFAAIGAAGVARDLDAALVDLAATPGAMHRRRRIVTLQNRLLATDEPVDTLLARFAVELFGSTHARLRREANAARS